MSDLSIVTANQQSRFLAPAATITQAIDRYQMMAAFVKAVMKSGVDYGVIPGSDKPTLLKPGAEKLSSLFGLSVKFTDVQKIEDWTGEDHNGEPFFFYHYRASLFAGDRLAAEGEGLCHSFESKYRYRQGKRVCPSCGKEAIIKGKAEFGGGWLCFKKSGGCGAKFGDNDISITGQAVGRIVNPDICDQVNTILKMAQKRALVAGVLIACGASEYFTQDVEDYINAEWHEPVIENAPPATTPAPEPVKPAAPAKKDAPGKYDDSNDMADDSAWGKFFDLLSVADESGLDVQKYRDAKIHTFGELRKAYAEVKAIIKAAA